MSLLFTEASSNALVTVLIDAISAGEAANKPYVEIYAGTRPCDTSGTNDDNILLATVQLNAVPFATPENGMAIANESTPQTNIPTGGVATWFRVYNRSAVAVLDGDITLPVGNILPSCAEGGASRGLIDGDLIFDATRFFKGNLVGIYLLALTTPVIS
jgi:hypothetical protein